MEEFRDIKGYEGLYQVSNLGRVKSLKRLGKRKETILKHSKGTNKLIAYNVQRFVDN